MSEDENTESTAIPWPTGSVERAAYELAAYVHDALPQQGTWGEAAALSQGEALTLADLAEDVDEALVKRGIEQEREKTPTVDGDQRLVELIVDLVQALEDENDTSEVYHAWSDTTLSRAYQWLYDRGVDRENPGWETAKARVLREQSELKEAVEAKKRQERITALENELAELRKQQPEQ